MRSMQKFYTQTCSTSCRDKQSPDTRISSNEADLASRNPQKRYREKTSPRKRMTILLFEICVILKLATASWREYKSYEFQNGDRVLAYWYGEWKYAEIVTDYRNRNKYTYPLNFYAFCGMLENDNTVALLYDDQRERKLLVTHEIKRGIIKTEDIIREEGDALSNNEALLKKTIADQKKQLADFDDLADKLEMEYIYKAKYTAIKTKYMMYKKPQLHERFTESVGERFTLKIQNDAKKCCDHPGCRHPEPMGYGFLGCNGFIKGAWKRKHCEAPGCIRLLCKACTGNNGWRCKDTEQCGSFKIPELAWENPADVVNEIDDKEAEYLCIICGFRERTHAFQCGHITCGKCAGKLKEKVRIYANDYVGGSNGHSHRGGDCPICKVKVEKVIELYF